MVYAVYMENRDLVEQLIADGMLKTPEIISAFLSVDRKDFVPESLTEEAYKDHALPIGYGQTISQPSTVAFMFELLRPKKGDRVLDVGSGSGWTTALLAHCTGASGRVYGVELLNELVEFGKKNILKYGCEWASITNALPETLGLPEYAPYDKILVSASTKKYPMILERQLAKGGKMAVPVGTSIIFAEKTKFGTRISEFPGFAFVPLRGVNI